MLLLVSACASLPSDAVLRRPESRAIAPFASALGASPSQEALHPDESAFHMLATGLDGLAMRLELIDAAQRSLDLQYYIFRADVSGSLVADALLRAADRGVRVRVLVDDGDTVRGDERLFALAAHPLIQIRIFNPFDYRGHVRLFRALDFVFHKQRLDYRMHDKLLVADNASALIGGRNIGDQYFQIDPQSQFGDDEVAVQGPLVRRLSGVFDEFWNAPASIPVTAIDAAHTSAEKLAELRHGLDQDRDRRVVPPSLSTRLDSRQPLAAVTGDAAVVDWATAELIYDSPDKREVIERVARGRLISKPIESRIAKVNAELLMITPYLVPSPRESELLQELRSRNVRVRILTNSLEAAPDLAAHSGYAKARPQLLGEGIELHEIRARVDSPRGTGQSRTLAAFGNYALHAKLYVFDRRSLFVGSMNFDQRSERLNTEIGVIIDSPPIATGAATRFDELTKPTDAYAVQMLASGDRRGQHLVWQSEENGVLVTRDSEPGRSAWQRFKARLLGWLPLDPEL